MTGIRKFKKHMFRAFLAGILFTAVFTGWYARRMIPDHFSIVEDQVESFRFPGLLNSTLQSESEEVALGNGSHIPAEEIKITRNEPFTMYAKNKGSYRLSLKLFGLLPLKDIQVDVVDTRYAVPCGLPVGIYLKANGVMVIGTGEVAGPDGTVAEPSLGILQSGDYIEAINGSPLNTKEELIEAVSASGGKEAVLTVRRAGSEIDVKVRPAPGADGDYKLGAWVRDDTQGIGTMTYVDLNGHFGALGHGISDSDTGEIVQIQDGTLYETAVMGIEKGSAGKPGVMSGVIYYGPGSVLGSIDANTSEGIFGTVNERFRDRLESAPLEIGYRQDVQTGPAIVRSSVSGELKDYSIEIERVDYSSEKSSKGMVIKVTDPELLALTGGIVQGMSGSPIIQNGKLIGAVTHVFIQDSAKGYGIFIENMLEH